MNVVRVLVVCTVCLWAGSAWKPVSGEPQPVQPLQMLNRLQDGRWELHLRDGSGTQSLCLADRRRLIQIRHPDLACTRIVIEDSPSAVTVQYTCRGRGYGRTRIRRETERLIQLETQGIVDGLPFEFTAEGRRVGACPA